jgi:hypothetical protein
MSKDNKKIASVLPEEMLWQATFDHFKRHGASDRVAAANADHVTYGRIINSDKFKDSPHG